MNEKDWDFVCDREFEAFCEEIVRELERLHGVLRAEAIGRVNRQWAGQEIVGPDQPVYHEEPEYWANTLYYGPESFWWMEGADLAPLPFP